ncbi:MAG TPA: gamma-glutamyltransferase, partial [Longimicrobiales bacterium]|nr:gamma-glutamyltransferase [Longimicrobiales bacterium]
MRMSLILTLLPAVLVVGLAFDARPAPAQTQKPPLHGRHWMAITGKPLGATAGAMMFQRGGNAVDAAAAMLAATATMWDVLSWGGETQALIFNPHTREVIGINALGIAPSGATAEYFRDRGMSHPPEYGPLAATTPGTPGGLMVMLAEYGTMSLADVLAPAIEMAEGYPIEAQTANSIERNKERLKQWRYSREIMLPHLGSGDREAPYAGEIFRQPDLRETLMKLVEAEAEALRQGRSRGEAIMAAYDRFYRGDIAEELVRGVREEGGLFTMADLGGWSVGIEEPVMTDYRGVQVYKLTHWTQGPVLLQALNILENFDLQAMGYNSARYVHTLYQAMNLAFADRDFYYGDPRFPPEEPIRGLLSKDYARQRAELIDPERNDPDARPGDPYPFQGGTNPFTRHLASWHTTMTSTPEEGGPTSVAPEHDRPDTTTTGAMDADDAFYAGTTTIQAADAEGWVVSITPSGGWVP